MNSLSFYPGLRVRYEAVLLENRIVDDRRLGQQLGNFRLSRRYYVFPGEHCKDADQTI